MSATAVRSVSKEEQMRMVKVLPSNERGIECQFNRGGSGEILIFNPHIFDVAFKLKRTLPNFINISPGYGYVSAQDSQRIKIKVAKVKEDEAFLHFDHRVSVLVCEAPAEPPKSAKEIWKRCKSQVTCRTIIPVKFITANESLSVTKTDEPTATTSEDNESSNATSASTDVTETDNRISSDEEDTNETSTSSKASSSSSASKASSATTTNSIKASGATTSSGMANAESSEEEND